MILETLAWTTFFYTASFTLPCIVPRLEHQPKPAVFDNHNGLIADAEQDAKDRTIGQLVATGAQILMVLGALLDLITPIPTLASLVIGFYLYDIIHLYTKPYGKSQQIFIVHHAGTIVLVSYVCWIESPYKTVSDIFYILLELSSISINTVNLIKYFRPTEPLLKQLTFANIVIYGLCRVVLYPATLGIAIYSVSQTDQILINLPPICALGILYIMYVQWFLTMIYKQKGDRILD